MQTAIHSFTTDSYPQLNKHDLLSCHPDLQQVIHDLDEADLDYLSQQLHLLMRETYWQTLRWLLSAYHSQQPYVEAS